MNNNLQFSQGLFETFVYNGFTPSLERHLKRLNNSSKTLFDIEIDIDKILDILKDYPKNSVLKLLIAYEETHLYYEKPKNYKVYIKTRPKTKTPNKINLTISPYKRHSKDITIYHKTTNYLLNTLSKRYAVERRFFDAIFLNEMDFIQETSSSNLLFVKHGKLYTPSLESGLLFGITLQTLKDYINIDFISLTLEDLKDFESAFILNSLIGSKSVNAIDDKIFKIEKDLEDWLNACIQKENS